MEYNLCLDEDTLDFNGDGEAELVFDPFYFDLTPEGLAYKNNLAYRRPWAPQLSSDNSSITYGDSVLEGTMSRCRFGTDFTDGNGFGDYDFWVMFFDWQITFGAGFSIPSGTLYWDDVLNFTLPLSGTGGTYFPYVGVVGNAYFVDASNPANNRVRLLGGYFGGDGRVSMRDFTGVNVTNSNVLTFAVGDQIIVSGWAITATSRYGSFL